MYLIGGLIGGLIIAGLGIGRPYIGGIGRPNGSLSGSFDRMVASNTGTVSSSESSSLSLAIIGPDF
jgi:hypothetical protein